MFRTLTAALCGGLLLPLLVACGDRQSAGFALPPGDGPRGLAAFQTLGCTSCHRIEGVVERDPDSAHPEINVRLGGQVSRVKTYGELVTAIVHPSASLSRGNTPGTVTAEGASAMPNFNDTMTVQQLVDLTTFLQQTYTLWVPEYRPIFMP